MRLIREFGMYATPINYPTVPQGTERLRFTPGPKHTDAMMDELVAALQHILLTEAAVPAYAGSFCFSDQFQAFRATCVEVEPQGLI